MQFIDVSAYNNVAWPAYRTWSGMVALKSSEGVGFADPAYASHRAGAIAAGISSILHYHFARPDLGNSPIDEANWQYAIVGAIQPGDLIVLDFEVQDARATADWAYQFLAQQQHNYGKLPVLYASDAYIRTRLQDSRLAAFPLWLADWTYDPTARPPCPPPWQSYIGLQYTDQATNIPGIAGAVDADIFLGQSGGQMPPNGWTDDGKTLTAPNGHTVVQGFRAYILAHTWDADNEPLEEEHAQSPLELSNPSLGNGTQQVFRRAMLGWTQSGGVIVEWIGQELLTLRAQNAQLQAQLTALQLPASNITQATVLLKTIDDANKSIASATQSALTALTRH